MVVCENGQPTFPVETAYDLEPEAGLQVPLPHLKLDVSSPNRGEKKVVLRGVRTSPSLKLLQLELVMEK